MRISTMSACRERKEHTCEGSSKFIGPGKISFSQNAEPSRRVFGERPGWKVLNIFSHDKSGQDHTLLSACPCPSQQVNNGDKSQSRTTAFVCSLTLCFGPPPLLYETTTPLL